jgi:hypothetical protein
MSASCSLLSLVCMLLIPKRRFNNCVLSGYIHVAETAEIREYVLGCTCKYLRKRKGKAQLVTDAYKRVDACF